jgi:YD repeat-containing protein
VKRCASANRSDKKSSRRVRTSTFFLRSTSACYDADRELNRITEPSGRTATLSYFPDGSLKAIQEPLNFVTVFMNDIEGGSSELRTG